MKRILVPVDFSECSLAAASTAQAIATKAGAEIYFLHLLDDPGEPEHLAHAGQVLTLQDERKTIAAHIKSSLGKLVANAESAGLKATPVRVFNKGQEWIEDYIQPYKIDFVVMGSHGERGIKAVMGSNTMHVIHHTSVPVLVVKKRVDNFKVNQITFASDFSIDVVKPFQPVIELAGMWNATIHLLYVNTPDHFLETKEIFFNMKRFMHQFRNTEYKTHVCNAMNEEQGIHDFVKLNHVDIIALTTHGRTGISKILTHSIAERLVNHEDAPVLVVNIKSLL